MNNRKKPYVPFYQLHVARLYLASTKLKMAGKGGKGGRQGHKDKRDYSKKAALVVPLRNKNMMSQRHLAALDFLQNIQMTGEAGIMAKGQARTALYDECVPMGPPNLCAPFCLLLPPSHFHTLT